jgi:uncharacterized protein (DUF1800 family)
MKALQAPLAALLCCTLTGPSSLAFAQEVQAPGDQPTAQTKVRPAYKSTQLKGDERIEHALNRFTFGPKPGDVDAVRAMGLDRWFESQLHPESIDETDLNARLAQFPAMQWNTEDLLYRLPSNGEIRQAMNGKGAVPQNGTLHAIYENQIYRLQERKENKTQQQAVGAGQQQAPVSGQQQAAAAQQQPSGQANKVLASDGTYVTVPPAGARSTDQAPGMLSPSTSDNANPMAAPAMSAAQPDMNSAASSAQPEYDHAAITNILALEPQQRVARLVAMQPEQFESFIHGLRPVERVALNAGLSPELKLTVAALESPERVVGEELIAARLTRDVYSPAQLQEVMTDFWLNHFNVYLRKNEQMPYYLVSYERDTIRPRSLGRFEDLLEAVAHSPAMLVYLDNAESLGPHSLAAERAQMAASRQPNKKNVREGLNENYARELMELHTLGVNGGYTQADVTEVARVLTGWTIDRPQVSAQFTFNPNRHEPGNKKVMGQKIKDGGEMEGRELLHMLATRPATAQFISRKLAMRFVSDDPPQALVDRLAKSYLSSGGDISSVLRTLFRSPEFWSTDAYRAKVKTPIEYVVSAARASNAEIDNYQPLANQLRQMGMPVYGAIPPTGYNWQESTWVSTGALVDRMNFSLSLAANRLPGVTVNWTPLPDLANNGADPEPTPEQEELRLEPLLVAGGVSDTTRAAAIQQFQVQYTQDPGPMKPVAAARKQNRTANVVERQDEVLAGLLIGSPEFQRR